MTALAQYLTPRRRDTEPRAEGIGPRTVDLLKIVTFAQLALVSFVWAAVRGPWAYNVGAANSLGRNFI